MSDVVKTNHFYKILGCIIGIVLLFCSLAYLFFSHQDKEDQIRKIALHQRGSDTLSIPIFAEILSLSVDKPTPYSFDVKEARKQLYAYGIFKELSLKKYKPDLLFIDYLLHEPKYILGDLSNMLISEQGTLMPNWPYFTPKNIPTVYLGEQNVEEVFPYLTQLCAFVEKGMIELIDIRGINAKSKAKREVVMQIRQSQATHLLRIDPVHVQEQLRHYFVLLTHFTRDKQADLAIDLRFPEKAYVQCMHSIAD